MLIFMQILLQIHDLKIDLNETCHGCWPVSGYKKYPSNFSKRGRIHGSLFFLFLLVPVFSHFWVFFFIISSAHTHACLCLCVFTLWFGNHYQWHDWRGKNSVSLILMFNWMTQFDLYWIPVPSISHCFVHRSVKVALLTCWHRSVKWCQRWQLLARLKMSFS